MPEWNQPTPPDWEPLPRCQGTSKQTGKQCQKSALAGKRVCQIHGGKTPSGLGSRGNVNGKNSKYGDVLKGMVGQNYERMLQDPDLLVMTNEIALLDARLMDLMGRADTGEGPKVWQLLKEEYAKMLEARAEGKLEKAALHLDNLGTLITRGLGDWQIWGEAKDLWEERRRLTESERKRMVEAQMMVDAPRILVLFNGVALTLRKWIKDERTLGLITADLKRLVGWDDRPVPGAGAAGRTLLFAPRDLRDQDPEDGAAGSGTEAPVDPDE